MNTDRPPESETPPENQTKPRRSDEFVRSFARGLSIIEALGRSPGRHTMAEIAALSGLTRATARRVLSTLVELGYAEVKGRYYRLAPRVLGLGLSYVAALPFWGYAQPILEELRSEIGESCALAVLDGAEIVYLVRLPARRILAMNLGVGSRLPAHAVSLGRVLLSGLQDDALDRVLSRDLQRFTSRTLAEPEGLREELDRVRKQGYAWVDGELDPAISGIAVPVRDHTNGIVAAISVNFISGSLDENAAKARFLVPLRRAAEDIRARTPAV